MWFNTAFVEDLILVFEKSDLDKSQSGKDKLKSFDDKMKLYISFMDEKQFRIHSEHSAGKNIISLSLSLSLSLSSIYIEQDGSVSNDEVSLDEVKSESEEDSTIKRKRKKKDGDEEGSEKKKDRKRKAVEENGSRKSPRKGSVGSRLRPRTATDSPRTPKKHSEVKAKSGEKRSKSQTELKGHKRNLTTSEDRDSSDKDQNNHHDEEEEEEDEELQIKEKEKAKEQEKEQEEKKKKRKKSGSQLGRSETASNSPRKEKISHPSKNLRMRSHSQKELKQKKTTPISPKEDRQTNNNHHHEASEDGSEGSSGSQRTPKLKKMNRSLSDALLKKNNEQDEIKVATTARKEKERSKPRKAKSLSSAGPLSPRGNISFFGFFNYNYLFFSRCVKRAGQKRGLG